MKKSIILILVMVVSSVVYTQQKTNPFDISVADQDSLQEIPLQTETNTNLFDIEESTPVNTSPIQNIVEFDNPFEVSHVPLRRSQVIKNSGINKQRFDQSKNQKSDSYYLPIIITLLSCVILGFVLIKERSIISSILRSINNQNFANNFRKTELGGSSIEMLFIYAIFFINIALFIYLILQQFMPKVNIPYLLIMGVCFSIYLVRHSFLKFISWLFPIENAIDPYNFVIQLVNSLLGVVLIPVNLLLAYGPEVLSLGICIVVIAFVVLLFAIRYYRGYALSSNVKTRTIFHFFIYFCTFEFLPFWMGYIYLNQFNN